MKNLCVLLIVVLMFSQTSFGFDFSEVRQLTRDAKFDANQSYRSGLPARQLIGKSPEYVLDYTTAYQSKEQAPQSNTNNEMVIGCASVGCLGIVGCLWLASEMDDGLFGMFVF